MKLLRDRFWLWGQDANSHQESPANEVWKLPQGNLLDAASGARDLGIDRICRVVMNGRPVPPFDEESEKLKDSKEVVWSIIGDSGSLRNDACTDLAEVLRQARRYPNITGAVLDDFFRPPTPEQNYPARYPLHEIKNLRDELHRFELRSLDFWVVLYRPNLELDIQSYLDCFDVITFWDMEMIEYHHELPENLAKFIQLTPGKRRYAGCYLWDYGSGRPLTVEEIRYECDLYFRAIARSEIEGIVFCSNCCCDFDLAAVNYVRDLIQKNGSKYISEISI